MGITQNEAQEISNFVAYRMSHLQNELKNEKIAPYMKDWVQGQIFEASKILKHIQDEYGINPNMEKEA